MRPVTLELQGFTAFRSETRVDFEGADLFALVGATGAGKSSVIDGMIFALYGCVPRLDQRAVEPVIAAGQNEARVRFDFTVADRPYTAVRVVRRQPRGGATTKEARLESGDEVLAGDARGVTEAAERILGLGFEQFTKCIVLPQGEFARFLHDKPRDRQDLLVRLLELGVFERMREGAVARQKAAEQQAGWAERQLAELAGATEEALAVAERRIAELAELRDALDEAQPRLDALAAEERAQTEAAARAREHVERLTAVAVPPDVASLAGRATAAEQAAAAADGDRAAAEERLEAAEARLAELPARRDLEQLRDRHAEATELGARREKGMPIVAAARDEVDAAGKEAARAEEGVAAAEAALEAARKAHAAHALAADLEPGAPCPVCAQVVAEPPERDAPPALAEAQAALEEAKGGRAKAARAAAAANERRAKAEQTLEEIETRLAENRGVLAEQPAADEVARLLEAVGAAEAELASAREAERQARKAAARAAADAKAAAERRDRAWQAFDEARDRVADLGPPSPDRSDLAGAWAALAEWARVEAERQKAAAEEADAARGKARAAQAELIADLARRCEAAGVEVGGARPRDACADALAAANGERDRLREAIARAGTLRGEQAAQRERAAVAEALARHLSARGFERWLLDEALQALCAGASDVLRELSGDQYSLDLDDQRNFAVVDHRNADERRSARTLSGGETFLASLALALTLAEHLRELAVGATPRLESIFLDEGFGTLDPETLDVVASTVEELGASGRTVGLVTHVRDLAERMPVRFEVRRGHAGSTVDRVEV